MVVELLAKYPKVKIVLSSATADPSIIDPFTKKKFKVHEFEVVKKKNFPVKMEEETSQNCVTVAQKYLRELKNGEQMLIFLPSVAQVRSSLKLFEESTKTKAHELVANQSPKNQEVYLKEGQVFFSTNIAETSLTFPNLKFVIDSGKTNVATFDVITNQFMLLEKYASKSTITQRQGRCGRTTRGTYIPLYDQK